MSKKDKERFETSVQRKEMLVRYGERILRGESTNSLIDSIVEELKLKDKKAGVNMLNRVREFIAETTAENNEEVLKIHLEIYEDIYNRFDRLDFMKGKLAVLQQKEKLLKLYEEENNELIVNTQNNTIIDTTSTSVYDVTKLTLEEQSRYNQLLEKMISKQ